MFVLHALQYLEYKLSCKKTNISSKIKTVNHLHPKKYNFKIQWTWTFNMQHVALPDHEMDCVGMLVFK